MTFTEEIKKELIKRQPKTKPSSFDVYIKQVIRIYRDVFNIDLDKQGSLKLGTGGLSAVNKYFAKKKLSDTTRANYYSALLEIMKSINFDTKKIKSVQNLRDRYRKKYDKIEDGLKSKKQGESYMSKEIYGENMITILNDKIDEYEKKIKEGSSDTRDKDLLQIWMILKIIREFRFRNEIATFEFVDKKTYDEEKKPTTRNMIVKSSGGWFISKNKYKTDKEYGAKIYPLKGQILKDIKFYNKTSGDGMLFKSSFQQGKERPTIMTSNALSKYLLKWSNKELPPVFAKDGSEKPRNLSTTMIVKIYESGEHGPSKKKITKDSKTRGNKPSTMHKGYVSTKEV